jgi:hypothetical protein
MISIVYDVGLYRRLLARTVKKGDVVLEIGPHTGLSTLGYIKKASLAVALDKSPEAKECFKRIVKENKNLVFLQDDVRGFEAVKKVLRHTKRCDVLALDLGGGRYSDTVYKVWASWSGVFKPKHSVIRNRGLAEFLQRARIKDSSIRQCFTDDGWLSAWGRATPYELRKQLDELKYYTDINRSIKDDRKAEGE